MDAKQKGDDHIVVWGDGSPTHEFLYVEDAAEGIALAAERYNESEPVNPSTLRQAQGKLWLRAGLGSAFETCRRRRRISIPLKRLYDKDWVETIARPTESTGRIEWDTTRPGGDCAANPCARIRTAAACRARWAR